MDFQIGDKVTWNADAGDGGVVVQHGLIVVSVGSSTMQLKDQDGIVEAAPIAECEIDKTGRKVFKPVAEKKVVAGVVSSSSGGKKRGRKPVFHIGDFVLIEGISEAGGEPHQIIALDGESAVFGADGESAPFSSLKKVKPPKTTGGKRGRKTVFHVGDVVSCENQSGEFFIQSIADENTIAIGSALTGDPVAIAAYRDLTRISKAKAEKKREALDISNPDEIWITPQDCADAICRRLKEDGVSPSLVLEPTAGNGAFVRACKKTWPEAIVIAIELRADQEEALVAAGADLVKIGSAVEILSSDEFKSEMAELGGVGLVVGNLPFTLNETLIPLLTDLLPNEGVLALLMRLGFECTAERSRDFWPLYPYAIRIPLAERPGFIPSQPSKTDGSEYAVFEWLRSEGQLMNGMSPHIFWKG